MRSVLPYSFLLAIYGSPVFALILDIEARVGRPGLSSSLTRRDPIVINNVQNVQYASNISIGGQSVRVLLDTGSSDLWVHFPNGDPSGLTNTGKTASVAYAVGDASGNINTAEVKIANFTVASQAFINVQNATTFADDFEAQGYDGLLGLGPNSGSIVRKKIGNSSADGLIPQIFETGNLPDNYISFLLGRVDVPNGTANGQFSIAEIIPPYSNITSMPKLDVDKVNKLLKAGQHWQAMTSDDGIMGPDGKVIGADSIVPKAPDGQFVAVLDSGFSLSQIPRDVADQIYGRVQGASYDTEDEWWRVPCGQYLNISFNFGGINYPIHPLDVVADFNLTDPTGKKICVGAFQPITTAFSIFGLYDMILGMSYLRNTYTLLDFGNWVDAKNDQGNPYIQMLPTTDAATAREEFIRVRLGGVDSISSSQYALLPASQMQHSPVSSEEKKKKVEEAIVSRWPYIFVGCLVFVILLVGFCVWKCCQRRRTPKASGYRPSPGFMGFFGKKGGAPVPRGMQPFGASGQGSYVQLKNRDETAAEMRDPFTSPSEYNLSHPQGLYSHEAKH